MFKIGDKVILNIDNDNIGYEEIIDKELIIVGGKHSLESSYEHNGVNLYELVDIDGNSIEQLLYGYEIEYA